jgi:heme exporter protein CcmD
MIDWSADHINFVIAAYAITAAVLILAVVAVVQRSRTLKAQLLQMNLTDTGQKDPS